MNEERDSIRLLVTQTLIALCRNQLDYKQELNVDALVAITIDHKEVIVINVKDSVTFNSVSSSTYPRIQSPIVFSPHSPIHFSSPLRNESADESIQENIYNTENNDNLGKNENINNFQESTATYNYNESDRICNDNEEDNENNNLTNMSQNDEDSREFSPQLTIIAPSDSVEDIPDVDNPNFTPKDEYAKDIEPSPTKVLNSSFAEKNMFPKISLKSFSPTHAKTKIQLKLNKSLMNTLNHSSSVIRDMSFSNASINKKILLHSSLTSSQIVTKHNKPTTTTVMNNQLIDQNQFFNFSFKNTDRNTTPDDTSQTLQLDSADKDPNQESSMCWSDFQSMLVKSMRKNQQEGLDAKPQLMQYIQSWSETTDANSHKRLRECMQAILLYEGRYVPVRDIQRLRLSGMSSQEIRSSMVFLNSIVEGRVGCYREIRGCIGVFYKCPPHLIDVGWLTLFGLSQQIYAIKYNSQMPLNATNRHSVVYWDRIHFSSPYITSTHSLS